MAEGHEPRPANEIIYRDYYITNHAVTSQSANGAYYSPTKYDISVSGFTPISVYITAWDNMSASVTPYIDNNVVGFISDISLTIGSIRLRVLYINS